MSFIELKNVTKTFNGANALKNLNITIEEGQVLGVLGRSGSGKSVLLNMLRGMKDYRPTEGEIIYNLAVCPYCLRVEPPSMSDKVCGCGTKFESQRVDFWNADRKLLQLLKGAYPLCCRGLLLCTKMTL